VTTTRPRSLIQDTNLKNSAHAKRRDFLALLTLIPIMTPVIDQQVNLPFRLSCNQSKNIHSCIRISTIIIFMRLNLSTQLAKLMRERKISQNALSRATGVSQPTINRILCNVTLHPRRDSIVRIANFFGVTPDSMYGSPSKKAGDTTSDSLNELYEKIRTLSDADRSALFSAVRENLEEVRPDNRRRRD